MFQVLAISSLCVAVAGCAAAPPGLSDPSPGPSVLAGSQLDSITAGTASATIDLAAFARGTNVSTSTAARLNSIHGKILVIDSSPTRATQQMIDMMYGSGTARAAGDVDARCSATPRIDGPTIYRQTTATQVTNPFLAICSCSLISVALSH